jgi:hypothetical protein
MPSAKLTLSLLVVLMLALSSPALAQSGPDESAVRLTLETYLHGLKFNDVESFKKAFHPEAKLFFVRKNGELGQLTQAQWYKGFEASAGQEERGELRIVSLEVTNGAATAKVVEQYPDSTYIDYISLLKLADGWKIVNKIFTVVKRAS